MKSEKLLDSLLRFSLITLIVLTGCKPASPTTAPEVINVHTSPAAQPWLPDIYDCAQRSGRIVRLSDPQSADMQLRVGEAERLDSPSFEIGKESILIVTHSGNSIQTLTIEGARALFAGQGDASFQIWVYPQAEDVQQVFSRTVMQGRPVTSLARLATSPQQMVEILGSEANAVGILPGRWKTDEIQEVFRVDALPVLVITKDEPAQNLKEIIHCLQQ